MSAGSEEATFQSEDDETHWWIAYAEHSAVDGTAHRDTIEHGRAAEFFGAGVAPRRDVAKSAAGR